jgi:hypothetical protein
MYIRPFHKIRLDDYLFQGSLVFLKSSDFSQLLAQFTLSLKGLETFPRNAARRLPVRKQPCIPAKQRFQLTFRAVHPEPERMLDLST